MIALRNPKMAEFKVIEYHDSLGNRRGWTVVTLPAGYRDGDTLPPSHLSDRYFETEAEAAAELERLTAQPMRGSK
jgi:hypothetical protein